MTNTDILRIAMEQHAVDANCSPDDFTRADNVVVISKPSEDARRYLDLPFFCEFITYGSNIVASVDERVYEFVKRYIDTEYPHECFETPQIHHLTNELVKYGFMPGYQAEYWLPDVAALQALPCRYETRLLERGDFEGLYLPEWSNALCENRRHIDMLSVGAYDGDKLIGLSGCSADCDAMWQIGIDVLPEYRRQGIAAALTSQLAVEVIKREKVPFYCCSWSNLGSVRNAIKSGFRPAWIEHTAIEKEKALEWNVNKHFSKQIKVEDDFWSALDKLTAESKIVIDRPKGSRHPKYPNLIYPVDYGYLENTTSMDGGGIDVWRGTEGDHIDAIICTVDLFKKDSEIKILIGCNEVEKKLVLNTHNNGKYMKGILIRRDS